MVTKYHIRNLDCADCGEKIENHLRSISEIRNVSLNFGSMTLLVDTDRPEIIRGEIRKVEPLVDIIPLSQSSIYPEEDTSFKPNREIFILSIAIVLFVIEVFFGGTFNRIHMPWIEYPLVAAAYLLAGWNVLKKAFLNVKNRTSLFDENVLMTIATLGAVSIHALSEAVGVMIFYKIGEYLQNLAVARSRKSIRSLLAVRPSVAHVKRDGTVLDMAPDEVGVGEEVIIRPGERIPLDSSVVSGNSLIDTSALTGEPVPLQAATGSSILAGEINLTGLITARVSRPFASSSIARVLELVEHASTRKARTERFVSRISRIYTPAVVGAALALAVVPPFLFPDHDFRMWLYRALVLLVISCPCALVISIPLGFFGGIGGASRRGILVKGANYLELLSKTKTVVFDKTGTLTKGVFKVLSVKPSHGFTKEELIRYAASAEYHSNHPIAQSIRNEASSANIVVDRMKITTHDETAGSGVSVVHDGRRVMAGNRRYLETAGVEIDRDIAPGTIVHVAVENRYAGSLEIGDELKPEAVATVKKLRELGVHQVFMLSGDNEKAAQSVAAQLGIDGVYAGLLPHQKVEIFERLEQEKHHDGAVVFVGDGVNDAPVLARADVGIAMGTLGSDAAIETADVVIAGDSPERVVDAIRLGRRTQVIVWQNIVFAIAVKLLFISFGAFGLATMWEAVFADMGTAILAVFNSTRALK